MKIKPWKKPELIILSRSNSLESVLTACKNGDIAGPQYSNSDCYPLNAICYGCDAYSAT